MGVYLEMFRDKPLNLAFLISISFHLLILFCITIVILPANFEMMRTSTLSFLGPILEKTAFEMMLEQKPQPRRPLYRQSMHFDDSFLTRREEELEKLKFETVFTDDRKQGVKLNTKDLLGNFKLIPSFGHIDLNLKEQEDSQREIEHTNFSIEGTLTEQEILFKPELPVISKRIDRKQKSFTVELKFKVIPNGAVEEAVLLASSGYPDIDLAGIAYIKGFKFSPLTNSAGKPAWGKIKVNFETK